MTALDHAERVGRLVLTPCEAFDNLPPGLPGRFAGLAGRLPGGLYMCAQTLRWPPMRRLPITFGWMATGPIPDELFRLWIEPLCTQRAIRRDLATYVRTTEDGCLMDAAERLRSFPRPVLVAWAADDRIMPIEHGRRLADLVPDGQYVEVAGCRTLMPLDQPTVLADLIRRFGRDHPAAGPASTNAPAPVEVDR